MSKPTSIHRGWKTVTLGEVLTKLQYGTSTKASANKRGVPVLRMGNIQNGRVVADDLKYLELPKAELERYRLVSGDILINRTNSAELVGKAGVFDLSGEYVFASYLIRLQVNRASADPAFVNHTINSGAGQAFLKGQGKASIGQSNINTGQIRKMPLVLPPIPEQRRLVARVEALTRRLDQASQVRQSALAETQPLLNSLREDIYQKLLNEFPNKPLGECGEVLGGGTPSKTDEGYWNGNIPWVSAKEMWEFDLTDTSLKITGRAVKETTVKLVPPGSVLFVVRGSILFKRVPVAVNRVQCTINQDMKAIVPIAELNGDFLAQMLWGANEDLKGMVDTAGNSAGKLPTERWETLPIPIPPPKEQKKIIARLDAMRGKLDELQRLQREVEAELASFTPALLAKAFRGEL